MALIFQIGISQNTKCDSVGLCKLGHILYRAAPIRDFINTSNTNYCCEMYSQVQVSIPIHGSTLQCAVTI